MGSSQKVESERFSTVERALEEMATIEQLGLCLIFHKLGNGFSFWRFSSIRIDISEEIIKCWKYGISRGALLTHLCFYQFNTLMSKLGQNRPDKFD